MRKIPIVDHDRIHGDALAASLADVVGDVQVANSAEQALEQIILSDPEAIIVDVALPGLDGELGHRLSPRNRRHTELLALIRAAAGSVRDPLIEHGFDEVIQKPASLPHVLRAIYRTAETHLERAHRYVYEGERRVADQRRRIETLRREERDTTAAETVLATFEAVLVMMRNHLALEEREGAEKAGSPELEFAPAR